MDKQNKDINNFSEYITNFTLLFLITIILTSCALLAKPRSTFIDQRLLPYVKKFKALSRKYGRSLDTNGLVVKFTSDIDFGTLGICSTGGGLGPEIRVSESAWFNSSPQEREMVIFHELGHCLLGRKHTDVSAQTSNQKGRCLSIMASSGAKIEDYINNHQSYMVELFTEQCNEGAVEDDGVFIPVLHENHHERSDVNHRATSALQWD